MRAIRQTRELVGRARRRCRLGDEKPGLLQERRHDSGPGVEACHEDQLYEAEGVRPTAPFRGLPHTTGSAGGSD